MISVQSGKPDLDPIPWVLRVKIDTKHLKRRQEENNKLNLGLQDLKRVIKHQPLPPHRFGLCRHWDVIAINWPQVLVPVGMRLDIKTIQLHNFQDFKRVPAISFSFSLLLFRQSYKRAGAQDSWAKSKWLSSPTDSSFPDTYSPSPLHQARDLMPPEDNFFIYSFSRIIYRETIFLKPEENVLRTFPRMYITGAPCQARQWMKRSSSASLLLLMGEGQ